MHDRKPAKVPAKTRLNSPESHDKARLNAVFLANFIEQRFIFFVLGFTALNAGLRYHAAQIFWKCQRKFRLAAIKLDVAKMDVYQPRGRSTGWVSSVPHQSPACADAPGYLLGTDFNGLPLAQTLIEATETFFEPALLCCAIAIVVGTFLGAVAGYFRGGVVEPAIKLLLTVIASYPRLILVIVAVGIFTASRHDPGGTWGCGWR